MVDFNYQPQHNIHAKGDFVGQEVMIMSCAFFMGLDFFFDWHSWSFFSGIIFSQKTRETTAFHPEKDVFST